MSQRCRLLLTLIVLITPSHASQAQSSTDNETSTTADRAYNNKDWKATETLYGSLLTKDTTNGRYWYRLGVAQKSLGKNGLAVESFSKAEANGVPKYLTRYAMAEVQALNGSADGAFAELGEAMKAGYATPDQLSSDPDLALLHGDPRFAKAVEQAQRASAPCKYSPENRQFDFWIGEWSVTTAKGDMSAGDSRIELALGDCVIVENWTSRNSSYAGKSYNVYNVPEKRWEQFWVDNSQGMVHFIGGLKDGVMDFYTQEVPQADGSSVERHLRFFPLSPDKVRQYSQMSSDHGKTWADEYDFIYTRKK